MFYICWIFILTLKKVLRNFTVPTTLMIKTCTLAVYPRVSVSSTSCTFKASAITLHLYSNTPHHYCRIIDSSLLVTDTCHLQKSIKIIILLHKHIMKSKAKQLTIIVSQLFSSCCFSKQVKTELQTGQNESRQSKLIKTWSRSLLDTSQRLCSVTNNKNTVFNWLLSYFCLTCWVTQRSLFPLGSS